MSCRKKSHSNFSDYGEALGISLKCPADSKNFVAMVDEVRAARVCFGESPSLDGWMTWISKRMSRVPTFWTAPCLGNHKVNMKSWETVSDPFFVKKMSWDRTGFFFGIRMTMGNVIIMRCLKKNDKIDIQ